MSLRMEQIDRMEWEMAVMSGIECCVKNLNRDSIAKYGWPQADIRAHRVHPPVDGQELPPRPMSISVSTKVEESQKEMSRGLRDLLEDIVDQLEHDERWRYCMLRMEMRVSKTEMSISLEARR